MSKAKTRTIHGEEHQVVVLHITKRDRHGRPKEATIMYDEDSIHLQGGEEFLTAWVVKSCVDKQRVRVS